MTQSRRAHHDQPLEPEAVDSAPEDPADAAPEGKEAETGPEEASLEEAAPEEAAVTREAELEAELAEAKERLLRALAETENLRRRSAREVEEAHKYAISGFARELLDVSDNLSRALASIPQPAREEIDFVKTLADGVAMTEKMLAACFERHRIAKVEPQPGDKFDHNRHQAMFEVATDQHPPGTVAQVMQPGYVIADRLLRPALVGVAKPPATETAESEEPGATSDEAADAEPGSRIDTTA